MLNQNASYNGTARQVSTKDFISLIKYVENL